MRRFRIERDADGLPARMYFIDDWRSEPVPLAAKCADGTPRCLHVEGRVQCAGVGVYPDARGRTWCGQHRRGRKP